ncbi:hypothetical protein Fmac_005234 [Flemingia macrophylla]|uniref:Uncharacterized protein n=1 Tax=Flemingia macrophylla TaxID=520843 RepID=A0ABD1N7C0_9FABA
MLATMWFSCWILSLALTLPRISTKPQREASSKCMWEEDHVATWMSIDKETVCNVDTEGKFCIGDLEGDETEDEVFGGEGETLEQ